MKNLLKLTSLVGFLALVGTSQACFYNDAGFSGASFCLSSGQTMTSSIEVQ